MILSSIEKTCSIIEKHQQILLDWIDSKQKCMYEFVSYCSCYTFGSQKTSVNISPNLVSIFNFLYFCYKESKNNGDGVPRCICSLGIYVTISTFFLRTSNVCCKKRRYRVCSV